MLKRSKIILLLYAVAVTGLVYYAYPIVKNRYFAPREEKKDTKKEGAKDAVTPTPTKKDDTVPTQPDKKNEDDKKDSTKTETETFLDITKADCDNKCVSYKNDPDEYKYCQEICGLSSVKKTSSEDCDNREDLEKDYCLKDLAVSKKDFKLCDQIDDSGVKKSCQNRVTEEILNGNSQND